MADCPPNNADCSPAGANPTDPCSPCFEPTKENFLEVLAELARQICAQGNMIKGWNQKIDKFRNRMNRLEDSISNLPGAEEAEVAVNQCANLDNAEEVDSLTGCDDGVSKGLFPDADDCSDIVGKDGRWKVIPHGLTWYPLDTPQVLTTNWATQVFTNLNGYDDVAEIGCDMWAVVNYQDFLTGVSSGVAGTSVAYGNNVILGAQYINNGSETAFGGVAMIPLPTKSITLAVSNSFSGGSILHSSSTFVLLGYFA